jgi:hypothetical protein
MQKFIEKYFDISHDAAASLLITLSTFLLGYIITGLVYIISKYFQRKSNRKIFIENLTSLNKSLKRQEKEIGYTLKTFDIVKNAIWSYAKVEFFQIPVFREMSYKDTFNSFFLGIENQLSICISKKLKRRAFNKTWENLNNIQIWSEKAFNDFNPILEKYNQYGGQRNKALNELRIMWEQLFQNVPQNIRPEELEYLKQLDTLIATFQKIPSVERLKPYATHRSLILKIRILNRKYPSIPFVRLFNDKALEVSNHYHDMELLLRHTKYQYQEYYHVFRRTQKTNQKIIAILS